MSNKSLLQKYEHMWVLLQEFDDPLCAGRGDEIRALKDEIREELATPSIVYVVTGGEYSDQWTDGVYDDHALATAHIRMSDGGCTLQAYPLNEHTARIHQGLAKWCVNMKRDGDTVSIYGEGLGLDEEIGSAQADIEGWRQRQGDFTVLCCKCWARGKEHAIKITNEIRTQILAADNWHEDYVWQEEREDNNAEQIATTEA